MLKRFLACVVVLGVMTSVATAEVVFQWEPTDQIKAGENTTLTLSVYTNEPRELGVGGFFFFLDNTDPKIQLKDFRFDPQFADSPFYLILVQLERPDSTIQTVFILDDCVLGHCVRYPPDGSKLKLGELDVLVEEPGSFILNLNTGGAAEATDADHRQLEIKGGLETKLTVVPEPASLALLGVAVLVLVRRRRC